MLMNAPGAHMTLVAIGPLTNIALLLDAPSECACNTCRLVLMGGSAGRGNLRLMLNLTLLSIREAAAHAFRVAALRL